MSKRKQPVKKIIHGIAEHIFDQVRGLTSEQRSEALETLRGLSNTNCWWAEYWVRDCLIKFVESEMEEARR